MNFLKNLTGDKSSGRTENWYITVERAEGVEDKDRWSKSDTYAKIEFGGKHFKTHTINNSRTPFWNETFNLKEDSNHIKDLHIKLMDDDFGLDDSIGSATISKADLPTISGDEKTVRIPIYKKDQVTGIVVVRLKKMDEAPLSSNQPLSQSHNISSSNYQSQQQPSTYPQQQQQYSQQQPQYSSQQQQPMYSSQQQQPMYSSQQQQPMYSSQQQPFQQNQGPQMMNPQQQQQPYVNPNANDNQYQQKRY